MTDIDALKSFFLSHKIYIFATLSRRQYSLSEKIKNMSFDTRSTYYFNENKNKGYVDNKELNRLQCIHEGVLMKNITVDKNCTYANTENFFSYRRNKQCGRHMSFIMLKEN